MHSSSSSLACKPSMMSTWPEDQIRRSARGFVVRNRENFRSSFLDRTWPTHIYLDKLRPNLPSLRAWVAVFSRNPPKRLLDRLHAMHSVWSTMVTHSFLSPSRLPHSPSEVLHSCRYSAPPCTKPPWPADVEILSLAYCPSEGLLPVGGLLPRPVEVLLPLTITHHPREMRPVHWLSTTLLLQMRYRIFLNGAIKLGVFVFLHPLNNICHLEYKNHEIMHLVIL